MPGRQNQDQLYGFEREPDEAGYGRNGKRHGIQMQQSPAEEVFRFLSRHRHRRDVPGIPVRRLYKRGDVLGRLYLDADVRQGSGQGSGREQPSGRHVRLSSADAEPIGNRVLGDGLRSGHVQGGESL